MKLGVTVEIPVSKLSDPRVARALARLMTALGGHAPKSYEEWNEEAEPLKRLDTTIRHEGMVVRRGGTQVGNPLSPLEAFIAGLSQQSQLFLQLLKKRGTLRLEEAIEALGLGNKPQPGKVLGGITGGIGRWAPKKGIDVPYETTEIEGERAWRWLGSGTDTQTVHLSSDKKKPGEIQPGVRRRRRT